MRHRSRFEVRRGHCVCVPVVIIPVDSLSEDALTGIIESFVLREGTDYGHREFDLASKCLAVRRQLVAGEAEIYFDATTDTIDIRPCQGGS